MESGIQNRCEVMIYSAVAQTPGYMEVSQWTPQGASDFLTHQVTIEVVSDAVWQMWKVLMMLRSHDSILSLLAVYHYET